MDKIKRAAPILNSLSECWGICQFSRISGCLLECRAKQRLPQNAASVIVALFPYLTKAPAGNLSRYAAVSDYHAVAGARLKKACEELRREFPEGIFEPFCDNSPIPEVRAAALGGLGVVGHNGLLIHEKYGSWTFIGEIVTDLIFPSPEEKLQTCLDCGACLKKCPGGALDGGRLAWEKCISHITQKKGQLAAWEEELIARNGLVWGCDTCQNCCPMNARVKISPLPEFSEKIEPSLKMGEIGAWPDRAYLWRGPKVLERNLKILEKYAQNGDK